MRTRFLLMGTSAFACLALLTGACATSSDEEPTRSDTGTSKPGSQADADTNEERPERDAGDASAPETTDGSDSDSGTDADASAQPITVTGRVVDQEGDPLSDIGVSVAGQAMVTTGTDGTFTFSNVTPPYEVRLKTNVGTTPVVHAFTGLRTATPQLVPISKLDAAPPQFQGTIQGTLSTPVSTGELARACVEGVDRPIYGCTVLYPGDDTFTLAVNWTTAPSPLARVRVLRFTLDAQGVTTGFTGEGSKDVSLSPNAAPKVNVALVAPPASGTLTTTVTPPAGATGTAAIAFVKFGPFLSFPLEQVVIDSPTPKSFVVPGSTGATFSVFALAATATQQIAGWETGLAAGGNAKPKLVQPPRLVAPAEGTQGVTISTTFDATNPDGIPLTFFCVPTQEGIPLLAVSTVESSATLPDVAGLGMTFPVKAAFQCGLLPSGTPGATADSLATGAGPIGSYARLTTVGTGGPGLDPTGALVTILDEYVSVTTQ
ncbi:Outer membrane autotransporter barrel [Labilithrix luteola]|uniref:Outer membrane autotransporter barrel n=1 Tax=Labilithrix luteola TaxID=1391654 RepID=A0A0K1QDV7_9BACT|nr:hypothetical protein [Labilithrix luteola]AKV03944.1 Outer membrane autotransporter barrel [Labilithrix luteola]